MDTLVIDTGLANLASVQAGLRRAGCEATVSLDRDAIAAAPRLVLPGVGAFGAGVERLAGVRDVLRERIDAGTPLLAICLGMQLLAASSEESPEAEGLGVFDARVRRLADAPTIPQLGWNQVDPDGEGLVEPGYAYYANSYAIAEAPEGWRASTTEHGARFVAALQRGPQLACQFHPELSGAWGRGLIGRWLEMASC